MGAPQSTTAEKWKRKPAIRHSRGPADTPNSVDEGLTDETRLSSIIHSNTRDVHWTHRPSDSRLLSRLCPNEKNSLLESSMIRSAVRPVSSREYRVCSHTSFHWRVHQTTHRGYPLLGIWLPSKRLKKETQNCSKSRKGKSGWTDKAFSGIVRSSGALIRTAIFQKKNLRFGCKWKDCEQMPCEFHGHEREENMILSPLSGLLTIEFNIRQEETFVKV